MNKENNPVPEEVIEYFQKVRAEQEYLKKTGIHINYVKPIMFKGKKVFALGNKVYADCPPNTTFHTFLIQILKEMIGLEAYKQRGSGSKARRIFKKFSFVGF